MQNSGRYRPQGEPTQTAARDRRISELGDVLQRQRQAVRELLSNDKRRQHEMRSTYEIHRESTSKEVGHSRIQTELYQRISTQIVETGNRVLTSARRHMKTEVSQTPPPPPITEPLEQHLLPLPC
jgi:hypothetical protein